MVATTSPQLIRYPQLADAPCDWDTHMANMALDIDAKLTSHDTDLTRTLQTPMVMLRLTTPTDLLNTLQIPAAGFGPPVPFDTVEFQAGGTFARLSINPFLFRMPRTGYYQVGFNYFMAAMTDIFFISPTSYLAQMFGFNLVKYPNVLMPVRTSQRPTVGLSVAEKGVPDIEGGLSGLVRVTATTDYYQWCLTEVGFGGTFDDTVEILGARAYAFWVADL